MPHQHPHALPLLLAAAILVPLPPMLQVTACARQQSPSSAGADPSGTESKPADQYVPAERQPGQPAPPTGEMVHRESHQLDEGKPAAPPEGRSKPIQVTGRLTREGVECPALRTAKGKIYTLAGDLKGFHAGDRVTVTGTLAQASICQQGTTIDVRAIRRAAAPKR